MIPHDAEERKKMIRRMLNVCVTSEEKLTTWESGFIESIDNTFATYEKLTDRQCEILEKIYDKVS